MISFVIIGGGWRSEFYLRIAKALPEQFRVSAICIRNSKRTEEIARKFDVTIVNSVSEVLKQPFDFIVNCINKEDISDLSVDLADRGYYVLSETPIIKKPEEGHAYDRIQVAEQFRLKGSWQAVKKILDIGVIGEVNHINISVAHDYHAMSLVRFFLQDYEEPKLLFKDELKDTILKTNGRVGVMDCKKVEDTNQVLKVFRFKNASVIYDYNIEQYFSPIRRDRFLVRGTRGEIVNDQVYYFNKDNKPITGEIKKAMSGLLDGFFYDKITFENQVLFEYPFQHARLSEEELAIAQSLLGMKKYMETGKELYSYERAYQDYFYFNL